MTRANVLIVGAGPTGLVLALWLTKQGVAVRIIDKVAEPGTTSRALAVHARTLELYRQLGLDRPVMEKGYTVPGVRIWLGGEQRERIAFDQLASDMTPYGFLHIFPQDEHERLLIQRLKEFGVEVERPCELLSFEDTGSSIVARLRTAKGEDEEMTADYIAGCDGARSKVREVMDTGFPGGTYRQVFYVADVAGDGPAFNGDLNVEFDEADFLAIFPLADKGRIRLIGAIRSHDDDEGEHPALVEHKIADANHDKSTLEDIKDTAAHLKDDAAHLLKLKSQGTNKSAEKDGDEKPSTHLDRLTFADIKDNAARLLKLKVDKVNWFSVYRVHHRVTEHFNKGHAFLLGDAAHIHTPVGGQGMNTGIGDAINLAWKLKAVLAGKAEKRLLKTYEAERKAFAERLVKTTDKFFNFAASDGYLAELVRQRIAPIVLPQMIRFEAVREYIFRTVSQLTLNYRDHGLAAGDAGKVHGGERLPWVRLGEGDNYKALEEIRWQIHVYGVAQPELKAWSEAHGIPLQVYAWDEAYRDAGLKENALYLMRPDTYVGFASSEQDVKAVEKYFTQHGFHLQEDAKAPASPTTIATPSQK